MITQRLPKRHLLSIGFTLLGLLTGCGLSNQPANLSPVSTSPDTVFVTVTPTNAPAETSVAPVTIATQPYSASAMSCSRTFKSHTLNHTTTIAGEAVRMFASNGSGVAINDLDNDHDLDIVLANLAGSSSIFWNEGSLNFRAESLPFKNTRAVNLVDMEGDGWVDIVFSQRTAPPLYLRNKGAAEPASPTFTHIPLPGVSEPAYAVTWGDLDKDGDLDLVTGSYDAELSQELGNTFLFGPGAGVFYYENQEGQFRATRLADEAQALAIFLTDLNNDDLTDIMVGNDFGLPDYVWFQHADGWQAGQPFAATTHSTMSFASGDINNDGQGELLATDMKPYRTDAATLANWQPVFEMMADNHLEDDPQIMENVLQVANSDGTFVNKAVDLGLEATGWSWSGKFGDLDHDGFLDIYVVNGMAAEELFGHLPNNELVEENQAFRNDGRGRFSPMPAWSLNATSGGRGMSMADLDEDGDLDIVVNNLLAPAQIFENQLCSGASLQIDLSWPQSQNTQALDAQLALDTSTGRYYRDIQATSGYLSGDSARVHFGLPAASRLNHLELTWPDGAQSRVEELTPNTRLTITRN